MTQSDRIEIDADLVRRLIAEQFPQWTDLAVRPVDINGWDNSTFRLGESMKVRLPTAERYVFQVEKEYRWLPALAAALPVEIPAPVAIGAPDEGYPYPWSIYRWIEGATAAQVMTAGDGQFAGELAGFLVALHAIPVGDAPLAGAHNFFRGGPLSVYDAETRHCLALLPDAADRALGVEIWDIALASQWDRPGVWVHGDIASGNLLVKDGHLNAVIDFGSSAVGDPACDLVIAWTFLDAAGAEILRSKMMMDEPTWARARGWALWKALLVMSDETKDACERAAARRVFEAVKRDHQGRGF